MDGSGIIGLLLGYGFMAACTLSAFLSFFYAYKKGILSLDENPKYQMLQEDADHERTPK